jgi:hypothetical protein
VKEGRKPLFRKIFPFPLTKGKGIKKGDKGDRVEKRG